MENQNAVVEKSKAFAVRIINLYKFLTVDKHESVMSKQLLKSGTSIGANVRESVRAASKADFVNKLTIALKEADETCYWLELLSETNYLADREYKSIYTEAQELVKLLVAIIKTTKDNLTDNS